MERAAFVIYMIVLVLSIFLFGAVHTYAYTLMTLGVSAATLLVFARNIKKEYRSGRYRWRFPKTSLNILFLVLFCFLVFQLIPMPAAFVKLLSPEAAVVQEKAAACSSVVMGQAQDAGAWYTLAPYTHPVRMSMIRWIVYGLFFMGLIQVLNSKKRINFVVFLLLSVGCFTALYGLIQTYSGSEHIWWFKKWAYKGDVCGTYINRNHFAGFMAMGILLAAAFASALSPIDGKKRTSSKRKQSLSKRIADALSREENTAKRILILFAGIVLGIGLIFSASRGGMIAAAGAMFLMGIMFSFRKEYRRNGLIVLLLFSLILAYAIKIGMEHPMERFGRMHQTYESRTRYAAKTIDIFDDYRFSGIGVGSFKYAFPKYQSARDRVFIRFAHNDWAQYLAEAGVMGILLLLGGSSFYLYKTLRLWARRKDPYAVSLGLTPMVVLAYMAVHSYSDFNLHIPANFLILLTIMAIGYAALHLERHHRRDVMNYRYYQLPLKYRGGVVLVLVLGLIGWTGYSSIRHFMGEVYCHTVPNSTMNRDQHPPVEELMRAISWDSGNAGYWYKLGSADYTDYTDEKEKTVGSTDYADYTDEKDKIRGSTDYADYADEKQKKNAWLDEWIDENLAENDKGSLKNLCNLCNLRIMALEKAVALNPFEAQYHLRLGWEYAHQWKEADYHTKWLPAADISMDRAAYFAGVKNPHLHQELGNYWTMRSRSVMPNDPVHHEAWAKACWHYQKAQSLETVGVLKRMQKEIKAYVWNSYPDDSYIQQVLN